MEEIVECLECGRYFKAITNTHLKSHGMTLDQYREKYPNAPMLSEKVYADKVKSSLKGADALCGLERPDYVKDKIRKTVSETVCDPEWREAQSDRMYQYYKDNPEAIEKLKGPRPCLCGDANPAKRSEVGKKISESKLGDKNSSKRPEVKKKIADSVKKLYDDPEYLARFQGKNNPMFGRIGKDAPNWQGGLSYGKYCEKFNYEFKEKVRNFFNRLCFLCGKDEVENNKKLDVHHVNYNKDCLCNSQCEFVPLCRRCHAKTSGKYIRRYWEDLIMCYLYPDRITQW